MGHGLVRDDDKGFRACMSAELQRFDLEFTARACDVVCTFEAVYAHNQSEAIRTAFAMLGVPMGWYLSACKLTNEKRLTKAIIQ